MKVDHVVYVVKDFAVASEYFWQRYGLASYDGGNHPDWGTGNWIVPLGESYIELFGIVDEEKAAKHPFGRFVQQELIEGDHLAAWSLSVASLEQVSDRLGSGVVPVSRILPDGSNIKGRMTGNLAHFRGANSLPFFVIWDTPDSFPGARVVGHSVMPIRIIHVEVGGCPKTVREWIGDEEAPVEYAGGHEGVRSVTLETSEGTVVIR